MVRVSQSSPAMMILIQYTILTNKIKVFCTQNHTKNRKHLKTHIKMELTKNHQTKNFTRASSA